jgi:deazaflavin-dependent oxidoreductase (nitroreductase family)
MTGANSEPLFLYLTTRGRRTGTRREIEIWFTQRDGRYYIIAEHGHRAQWVQNIVAHPAVSFRIGEDNFVGQARVVDPERDPHLNRAVQKLSETKYGWGNGLVVELIPD